VDVVWCDDSVVVVTKVEWHSSQFPAKIRLGGGDALPLREGNGKQRHTDRLAGSEVFVAERPQSHACLRASLLVLHFLLSFSPTSFRPSSFSTNILNRRASLFIAAAPNGHCPFSLLSLLNQQQRRRPLAAAAAARQQQALFFIMEKYKHTSRLSWYFFLRFLVTGFAKLKMSHHNNNKLKEVQCKLRHLLALPSPPLFSFFPSSIS
jgi:hypothetical protein